jgi:hypothetical protein
MQTFVPLDSFKECAKILDYRRLGKQRVEVLQLLNALTGNSKGWRNHPAALMWKDHEGSLVEYGIVICEEWIRRGYKDTCLEKIYQFVNVGSCELPRWWGGDIHRSHRAALLVKNFEYYSVFGWEEKAEINYVWPR